MKWFFGVVILILLALIVTNPGTQDFNKYLKNGEKFGVAKKEAYYLILSRYSYTEKFILDHRTTPVGYVHYSYVGLFNSFWLVNAKKHRMPNTNE